MRKIIVISMISMDGVMQAPGGPGEDQSGGFEYGGWTAAFGDEMFGKLMAEEMKPADYLLGRKTYDICSSYWPGHDAFWPAINEGTKHVLSTTLDSSDWNNTVFIKGPEDIRELKKSDGGDIQVWGSSKLVRLLLEHDLIDELRLKIYPVILGKGKKLFADSGLPGAYTLTQSHVTTKGVIIASYKRSGEVITGDVGPE